MNEYRERYGRTMKLAIEEMKMTYFISRVHNHHYNYRYFLTEIVLKVHFNYPSQSSPNILREIFIGSFIRLFSYCFVSLADKKIRTYLL